MDGANPKPGGGTEFFYVDSAGKKQDADLHAEMEAGVDDTKCRAASARFAMSLGVSKEDAMEVYSVSASDIRKVPAELEYGEG